MLINFSNAMIIWNVNLWILINKYSRRWHKTGMNGKHVISIKFSISCSCNCGDQSIWKYFSYSMFSSVRKVYLIIVNINYIRKAKICWGGKNFISIISILYCSSNCWNDSILINLSNSINVTSSNVNFILVLKNTRRSSNKCTCC